MVIASASDVMLEEGEECRFSGRVELFVGGVHGARRRAPAR